jgi:hypothetical protein
VKKAYSKVLAAEGYATGSNGGVLGIRKGPKIVKPVLGEQRRGPGSSSDQASLADEDSDEGSQNEAENEEYVQRAQSKNRRRNVSERDYASDEQNESSVDSEEEEEKEVRKGRAPKFIGRRQPVPRSQPAIRPNMTMAGKESNDASILGQKPHSTPNAQLAAPEIAKSARKPRLTSPEIEKIRQDKAAERREWAKRNSKGQPKLGNRMEILLGKIKKSLE